jgi:hypothetical protein
MPRHRSKFHSEYDRKIHPKLRMIANGDTIVNVLRAELCGVLAAKLRRVASRVPRLRGDVAEPLGRLPAEIKPLPGLKQVSSSMLVDVFVEFNEASGGERRLPGETGRIGNVATA